MTTSLRWREARQKQPHRIFLRDCFVTAFLAMTFSILLFSCGQDKKTIVIPSDVLSKEKMTEVLTEIHLAEAEVNMKTLPDSIATEKLSFHQLFDKNKITRAQFEKSLSFYIDHPELLNEVYEQVLNELSKMQVVRQ